MKKIYILAIAVLFSTAIIAQVSEQGNATILGSKAISTKHFNDKTPTDTTAWVPNPSKWLPGEFALGGQVWNYGYTGGGYVYGVNISVNEINHCAQGYLNLNAATFGVEGIIVAFVGKTNVNGPSDMTLNLYNMAPNSAMGKSTGVWAQNEIGPTAAIVATTPMAITDADTTWFTLNYSAFPSVALVSGTDFAVSVNSTAVKANNDTVGIACDADGEGFRMAYHYVPSQSKWYLTDDLFGGPGALNNNIAIFAVIDDNFVGIEDHEFLNNMQLSAFPNPAVNETKISYNLNEDMDNVKLIVLDMTGKEVYNEKFGSQAKGSYSVTLDASEFTSGNYFYSLISNGNRITKRMVITK